MIDRRQYLSMISSHLELLVVRKGKEVPKIGDTKVRPDGRTWVKTGTYSWALADTDEGKAALAQAGKDAPKEDKKKLTPGIPPGLDNKKEPEVPVQKAGVLLFDTDGNMILGNPTGIDKLDMFKGSVDEGEDPRTAALRELEEETGVTLSPEDIALVDVVDNYGKSMAVYAAITDKDPSTFECKSLIDNPAYPDRIGKPEMAGYKVVDFDHPGDNRLINNLYTALKGSGKLSETMKKMREEEVTLKTEEPTNEMGSITNPYQADEKIEIGQHRLGKDGGVYEKTSKFTYRKVADALGVGGHAAAASIVEDALPPPQKKGPDIEALLKSAIAKAGKSGMSWASLTAEEKEAVRSKYRIKADDYSTASVADNLGCNRWDDVTLEQARNLFEDEEFMGQVKKDILAGSLYSPYTWSFVNVARRIRSRMTADEMLDAVDGKNDPQWTDFIENYTINSQNLSNVTAFIKERLDSMPFKGSPDKRNLRDLGEASIGVWTLDNAERVFDAYKGAYDRCVERGPDANSMTDLLVRGRLSSGSYDAVQKLTSRYDRNKMLKPVELHTLIKSDRRWADKKAINVTDADRALWQGLKAKANKEAEFAKLFHDGDGYVFKEYRPFSNKTVKFDKMLDYSPYFSTESVEHNSALAREIEDDIQEGLRPGAASVLAHSVIYNSGLDQTNPESYKKLSTLWNVLEDTGYNSDREHLKFGDWLTGLSDSGYDLGKMLDDYKHNDGHLPVKMAEPNFEKMMERIEPLEGNHWGSAESTNGVARAVAAISGMTWRPLDKMKGGKLESYAQRISVTDIKKGLALRKYAQERIKNAKGMSREEVPQFHRGQFLDGAIIKKMLDGEADTILLTGATAMTASKGVAFHYATSDWKGTNKKPMVMHIDRDDVVDSCIGHWNTNFNTRQKGIDSDKSAKDFMFEGVSGLDSVFIYKVYNPNSSEECAKREKIEDFNARYRSKKEAKLDDWISKEYRDKDVSSLKSLVTAPDFNTADVVRHFAHNAAIEPNGSSARFVEAFKALKGNEEMNNSDYEYINHLGNLGEDYKSALDPYSGESIRAYHRKVGLPIFDNVKSFVESPLGLKASEALSGGKSTGEDRTVVADIPDDALNHITEKFNSSDYFGFFMEGTDDIKFAFETKSENKSNVRFYVDTRGDPVSFEYKGKKYKGGFSYDTLVRSLEEFDKQKRDRARRPVEVFCRQGRGKHDVSFDTSLEEIEKSWRRDAFTVYA